MGNYRYKEKIHAQTNVAWVITDMKKRYKPKEMLLG